VETWDFLYPAQQCVSLGTYSKAYEFFCVDKMPHSSPVRVTLTASVSQNQSLFHRDWNHEVMALDSGLYEQRDPICHLIYISNIK
jgi:hypothetical protein